MFIYDCDFIPFMDLINKNSKDIEIVNKAFGIFIKKNNNKTPTQKALIDDVFNFYIKNNCEQ